MRTRIATLTILSLLLLAVCCQVLPLGSSHDQMESVPDSGAHLALQAMALPDTVSGVLFILIVALCTVVAACVRSADVVPLLAFTRSRPPDFQTLSPLRLAFADGIVHPKLF